MKIGTVEAKGGSLIVNLTAFFLVAAGVSGIVATVRMQLPHLGFYSVGSEVLIYALLILTGLGLFFRLRAARLLALGWLKVGALAIILVPIAAVIWMMSMQQGKGPLEVIGMLAFFALLLVAGPGKAEPQPIYWTVFALVGLAVFSYVCRRLFRYLRSEAVAVQFKSGATSPAAAPRSFAVYACMAAYLALAFYAQHRYVVPQYNLPRFLQTREHLEQTEKNRLDALSKLVGYPYFTDGGRMFVSVMGYAPFLSEVLSLVDIATGKMTRIEVPWQDLRDAGAAGIHDMPRRLSPDVPLLWLRGNEILDLRTNQRRKMQVADEYRRFMPIGFLAGSKRFLLYDPENLRIHSLDVDSGAFVWSLDVTPVGGFTREEYKSTFHSTIVSDSSALSPDRSRFVYLYVDTLYVVDTEAGKLESQPASGHEFRASFSREGDWVVTMPYNSEEPAALYDLKAKKRIPHGMKGTALHFSSATGRVVGVEYRYEARTGIPLLTRTDLSSPAKPRWRIEDPNHHTYAATEDGKRLYALNPGANRIEYLDLDAVTGDAALAYTPLPVELPLAERRFIAYSADGRLIAVLHSPKMTLIRTDAGAPPTVLDFSQFAYRPKED